MLAALYDYFGAHRVDGRGRHEIDRAIQRVIISLAVSLATARHEDDGSRLSAT